MSEYIRIGQIVNTHGLKGEVRVYPLTERLGLLGKGEKVYLSGMAEPIRIEGAKTHKNLIILKLEGVGGIEKAQSLKNKYLMMEKTALPPLEEGRHYHFELMGMKVYLDTGAYLGKLTQVLQTGANDVYEISGEAKVYLVPAIEEVILSVNTQKNEMIIHPLEGLFDED